MSKSARTALIGVSSLVVLYALLGALLGKEGTNRQTYRNLGVYSEVLSRIKSNYVTEPNLDLATEGALRGLLETLGPYNTYFTAEEYRLYEENQQKPLVSPGLVLWKRFGYGAVISVLPGSPAEKAGLRPGDLIEKVDDASTRTLSLIQIEEKLKGPEGSETTLSVIRESRGKTRKITLTRTRFPYPAVTTKVLEKTVGYLRIPSFEKGKARETRSRLQALMKNGARKIIVDVRDSATGDPTEAAEMANFFLQGGLITFLEGQRHPRQDFTAEAGKAFCKLPLAVLIDSTTAGPAEIFASAILENERGEAIGVRSFGMGSLLKAIPLDDGSALLLSVAKYHTPSGKKIQGEGVDPTVEESFPLEPLPAEDEEGTETPRPLLREKFGTGSDPQLKRALEVLREAAPKAA